MERHIGPANPDRNAKGARYAAEGDPRLIRPDMLYLFQHDRREPLRSGDNNYWNHTPMTNLQNVPHFSKDYRGPMGVEFHTPNEEVSIER